MKASKERPEQAERPEWVPAEIDISNPSPARVYDYYLGGSHNFVADRKLAQGALKAMPNLAQGAAANRSFLRRATLNLIEQGITQFIDIGSGIPTVGNTHEVAQEANPDARVVYVDMDPVAVAHCRQMLVNNDTAAVVPADLRMPDFLLKAVAQTGLLDFTKPVGVMLVAVLHFVLDEHDPYGVIAKIRDTVAPGSYFAISHFTGDGDSEKNEAKNVAKLYANTASPIQLRDREEVGKFFDGLTILDPGVVFLPEWRPDFVGGPFRHNPSLSNAYCAVGRKD